jgi:ParB family chromosome partitioning protein
MTVRAERQTGLGRGLASLIPQRSVSQLAATEIPISRIVRNPRQPRQVVDEGELTQLIESIRTHGVIQPILVVETLDGYQLVAGERRLRAAQLAGLDRVPAVIRQLADRDQLELALVENLQREDLNAIEEAHAFRQLIDEFGFNQEELAARVSRARSTVANTLRLLDLAEEIQQAVVDRRITEGHARAMAGLPAAVQAQLVETIAARDLSVRHTEELARRLRDAGNRSDPTDVSTPAQHTLPPDLERVESELREALGTKVSLATSRRGGRIIIEWYGEDELGRLYERLTGGTR